MDCNDHLLTTTITAPLSSTLPPAIQQRTTSELLAMLELPISEAMWHFCVHKSSTLPEEKLQYLLGLQAESIQVERLLAVLELIHRAVSKNPPEQRITCPDDILGHIPELLLLDHEELWVLLLDTKNQVQARLPIYKGTINSSVLRIAEIYRPALLSNCPGIIVCHNHPSGDPAPSEEDIEVTHRLREAGSLLDIELIDHLIVGSIAPYHFTNLRERLRW